MTALANFTSSKPAFLQKSYDRSSANLVGLNLARNIYPDLPIIGLFCNGEFGPSKNRTLLHGYAASFGLFVKRAKLSTSAMLP